MTAWLAAMPVAVALVAVFFLPGLCAMVWLRLPLLSTVALAPPVSVAICAVTAVLAGATGLAYGPFAVVVGTICAAVLLLAVRLALRRLHWAGPAASWRLRSDDVWFVVAVGIGACLIGWKLLHGFPRPDAISIQNDAIFHFLALRWGLIHGNGSSLMIAQAIQATGFYPAGWHDVVLPVLMLTNAPIAVGVNTTTLVSAALLWPLSSVYLVRTIVGARPTAMLVAGAASALLPSFPYLLAWFGGVYPNFLAVVLAPAVMGGLVVASRAWAKGRGAGGPLCAVACAGLGASLAQPNIALVLILAATALLTPVAWGWGSQRPRRGYAAVGGLWALALIGWIVLRPNRAFAMWPPAVSPQEALGQAMSLGLLQATSPWLLGGLVVVGCLASLLLRRHRWLVVVHVALVAVWVAGASLPVSGPGSDLRWWLAGGWYYDYRRLAAQLAITAVPLAGLGADALVRWLVGLRPWRSGSRRLQQVCAIALVVVLVVQMRVSGVLTQQVDNLTASMDDGPQSVLLSRDERALIMRIPQHVEPGEVIANNWADSSSFAYSLVGQPVTSYFRTDVTHANDPFTLMASLRDAATDPAVCPAVRRLHARYALDFGDRTLPGVYPAPGLRLQGVPGFTLVDQQGDKALYRIDVCW